MWLWNNEEFTEEMIGDYVGFVYLITNLENGMKYVGKKNFTRAKVYQRNKKKKRTRVASEWQSYTGSNKQLNEDIAGPGKPTLRKEILHLCATKGWLSYFETFEILKRGAIQSDKYYNQWVSCKIQRSHINTEKKNESARTKNLD